MDFDVADLLRVETAGWQSLCDGTGGDFYGSLMTDDGLMVLADGSVLDRDGVVASLADAPAWSAYEITHERMVDVGSDVVAFVYRARAFRASGGPPFDALMSSVYRWRGGRWRLALYQQTPVPDEESAEL
ncbi:nuclear transport factor 2 family protein [Microbacterium sp. zg.Y1090]|uniref:nuclear transport factor 2 family protein n=1 Tax=Microbacterium TaxID=33882 RepID=UPI00214B02BA|nr:MULTISPECIES: nuclear transport factor 2 family protein [unclassified Microbacterium]MCR2812689.1 nuclear transport factor 2 family protein [Microbacterium sp. zg.Y1084]MCR2817515.1 nuclear transport factor 2 family protein [Microbacterium sp. zg.Y1090]WIM29002.1 nuclear transport factor 2 family protein [Microbacterium sp. zg-Y1090]